MTLLVSIGRRCQSIRVNFILLQRTDRILEKKKFKHWSPYLAHSIRDKAIILLMSSSGIRVGGLVKLQLKHLLSISKYDLYQITVYKKTREQYITL